MATPIETENLGLVDRLHARPVLAEISAHLSDLLRLESHALAGFAFDLGPALRRSTCLAFGCRFAFRGGPGLAFGFVSAVGLSGTIRLLHRFALRGHGLLSRFAFWGGAFFFCGLAWLCGRASFRSRRALVRPLL